MKLSHFELRLNLNHAPALTAPNQPCLEEVWRYSEIWIDGQRLDEPHPVCVSSVLRAMTRPRSKSWNHEWHDIFTCGCGTASCANIDEGVGTIHTDDYVEWVFRRPQANKFGADPLGYKAWCEVAQWHHYRFDRHQATRELIRFMDEVWLVLKSGVLSGEIRSHTLSWFEHDPRPYLRHRGTDQWEAENDQLWQ